MYLKHASFWIFAVILGISERSLAASSTDDLLALAIDVYDVKTNSCAVNVADESARALGDVLFNTFGLSGNYDTACATCHLDEFGSTDGLPIAVGVGGAGDGPNRLDQGDGILVQRNALPLTHRASPLFKAYFWDGKAQLSEDGAFVTQIGSDLPSGFNSLLAAASILPLLERDEFLGVEQFTGRNTLRSAVEDKLYFERYKAVEKALHQRLSNPRLAEEKALSQEILALGIDPQDLSLVEIGNSIAEFISDEFQCSKSPWEQYVEGDLSALGQDQKEGAILFFGKGRCAECHEAPLFSDFRYSSIGSPQGGFGPTTRGRDLGRSLVTLRYEDKYLFRTPPLISVSQTPPYGHSGVFPSLESVVRHHFDPISFYLSNPSYYEEDRFGLSSIIGSRSDILEAISISDDRELSLLVRFLESL